MSGFIPWAGFEVGALDLLAKELEPVAKHVERAACVERLDQGVEHGGFQVRLVVFAKLGPGLGLRRLDECEEVL